MYTRKHFIHFLAIVCARSGSTHLHWPWLRASFNVINIIKVKLFISAPIKQIIFLSPCACQVRELISWLCWLVLKVCHKVRKPFPSSTLCLIVPTAHCVALHYVWFYIILACECLLLPETWFLSGNFEHLVQSSPNSTCRSTYSTGKLTKFKWVANKI